MHIGILSLEAPYESSGGGIAAYLRALLPGLAGAGHRATVIANSKAEKVESHLDGAVRVVPVRLPNLHWYLAKAPLVGRIGALPVREVEWSVAFERAARRIFEQDPVDVLESCETGALMVGRRAMAPLVIRLHGSAYAFRKHSGEPVGAGERWDRRLQLRALRSAAAVTAPSGYQAAEVAREMGWPRRRIQVVPNPLDPGILAAAESEPAVGTDAPIVLYAGRLAKVKGVEPLLRAVKEVRSHAPDARFVLAGPWQMDSKPASLGIEMSAETNADGVSWTGQASRERLIALYRRASVFVMPSYFESFGIAVIEAMAFGLPVVATTAGGLPELVRDGETGILVPPGDPHALSEALLHLLRDRPLAHRMGQAGRRWVLERFTPDTVARTMLCVYGGAVQSRVERDRTS